MICPSIYKYFPITYSNIIPISSLIELLHTYLLCHVSCGCKNVESLKCQSNEWYLVDIIQILYKSLFKSYCHEDFVGGCVFRSDGQSCVLFYSHGHVSSKLKIGSKIFASICIFFIAS